MCRKRKDWKLDDDEQDGDCGEKVTAQIFSRKSRGPLTTEPIKGSNEKRDTDQSTDGVHSQQPATEGQDAITVRSSARIDNADETEEPAWKLQRLMPSSHASGRHPSQPEIFNSSVTPSSEGPIYSAFVTPQSAPCVLTGSTLVHAPSRLVPSATPGPHDDLADFRNLLPGRLVKRAPILLSRQDQH